MQPKNLVRIASVTHTNKIKHLKINITALKNVEPLEQPIQTTTPTSSEFHQRHKLQRKSKLSIQNSKKSSNSTNSHLNSNEQNLLKAKDKQNKGSLNSSNNIGSKNTAEVQEMFKDVDEVKSEWMESKALRDFISLPKHSARTTNKESTVINIYNEKNMPQPQPLSDMLHTLQFSQDSKNGESMKSKDSIFHLGKRRSGQMIQSKGEYGYNQMLKREDLECKERFTDFNGHPGKENQGKWVADELFQSPKTENIEGVADISEFELNVNQGNDINFSSIGNSHLQAEKAGSEDFMQAKELTSKAGTENDKKIAVGNNSKAAQKEIITNSASSEKVKMQKESLHRTNPPDPQPEIALFKYQEKLLDTPQLKKIDQSPDLAEKSRGTRKKPIDEYSDHNEKFLFNNEAHAIFSFNEKFMNTAKQDIHSSEQGNSKNYSLKTMSKQSLNSPSQNSPSYGSKYAQYSQKKVSPSKNSSIKVRELLQNVDFELDQLNSKIDRVKIIIANSNKNTPKKDRINDHTNSIQFSDYDEYGHVEMNLDSKKKEDFSYFNDENGIRNVGKYLKQLEIEFSSSKKNSASKKLRESREQPESTSNILNKVKSGQTGNENHLQQRKLYHFKDLNCNRQLNFSKLTKMDPKTPKKNNKKFQSKGTEPFVKTNPHYMYFENQKEPSFESTSYEPSPNQLKNMDIISSNLQNLKIVEDKKSKKGVKQAKRLYRKNFIKKNKIEVTKLSKKSPKSLEKQVNKIKASTQRKNISPKRKWNPQYINRIYQNSLIQAKIQEETILEFNKLKKAHLLKDCNFRPEVNQELPQFLKRERERRKQEELKRGLFGQRRMLSLPFLERQNKWQKQVEAKIREEQDKKQEQEIKNCTFQPDSKFISYVCISNNNQLI